MPILMRWVPLSLLAVAGCTETTPASIPPVPPPAPGIALANIEPTGRRIAVGDSLQFQVSTNVATITSSLRANALSRRRAVHRDSRVGSGACRVSGDGDR
jgi:hypothetical protein